MIDRDTTLRELAMVDLPALEAVFDTVPDVVFFVKDADARYVAVNHTLVVRAGVASKDALRGRRADEVFPAPLGRGYTEQDRLVLRTGRPVVDRLELHLYTGGAQGWCLSSKFPLAQRRGVVGLSRDLRRPNDRHPEFARLAAAIDDLEARFDGEVRIAAIARRRGLSVERFERLAKEVFGLSPRELLVRRRLERATALLRDGDDGVAAIALACGYADHSAFSRQFKATVGLTPSQFRAGITAGAAPPRSPAGRRGRRSRSG
ncbi:MAG: AraC family transcriptional regulator [Nannocystaceae bacterium]